MSGSYRLGYWVGPADNGRMFDREKKLLNFSHESTNQEKNAPGALNLLHLRCATDIEWQPGHLLQ